MRRPSDLRLAAIAALLVFVVVPTALALFTASGLYQRTLGADRAHGDARNAWMECASDPHREGSPQECSADW